MSKKIDFLSHPTLSGEWIGGRKGQTFTECYDELMGNGYCGAVACGLPFIGGYEHLSFFDSCSTFKGFFFPVAALTADSFLDIDSEIEYVFDIGYRAIKIHPRLLNLKSFDSAWLTKIFAVCDQFNLRVFFCTYCFSNPMITGNMIDALSKALNRFPDMSLALIHGGGVNLLQFAEISRFFPNVVLDLSLTFMKYDGSSLDQDISFLFQYFDRKVVLGSDLPEWKLSSIDHKFNKTAIQYELSSDKIENIRFRNAEKFLGVEFA